VTAFCCLHLARLSRFIPGFVSEIAARWQVIGSDAFTSWPGGPANMSPMIGIFDGHPPDRTIFEVSFLSICRDDLARQERSESSIRLISRYLYSCQIDRDIDSSPLSTAFLFVAKRAVEMPKVDLRFFSRCGKIRRCLYFRCVNSAGDWLCEPGRCCRNDCQFAASILMLWRSVAARVLMTE